MPGTYQSLYSSNRHPRVVYSTTILSASAGAYNGKVDQAIFVLR